jgi:hypothetical protein
VTEVKRLPTLNKTLMLKLHRTAKFFILFCFLSLSKNYLVQAQINDLITGLGSGLNNHTSLIGIYAESFIKNKIAARVSGGYGMWGTKLSLGPRYYFNYPRGDDFGLSFSYVFGRTNVDKRMQTVTDGIKNIKFDLGHAYLIDLIYNHHWIIRRVFRFTVEAGYSIPLNTAAIISHYPEYRLADRDKEWLNVERPGGLILGASAAYIITFKR